MGAKAKKQGVKSNGKTKEKKPTNSPESADSKPEGGEVDYGGLPQRDLKKNLGCG